MTLPPKSFQEKHIKDLQDNKETLVEKTTNSGNEEIFKKRRKIADLQDDIECMHEKISNATTVVDRYNKLKDLNSQLKTKHRSHKRL